MTRSMFYCKKFSLAVILSFLVNIVFGSDRYSVTSGNWNSPSTWSATSGGPPGASVPGKNDNVYIEDTDIITVTASYECTSITFTGTATTLIVVSPAILSVKGSVTLNNLTDFNSQCYLTGTGTLECSSLNVGSDANPPPTDPLSSSVCTHIFISNISLLNISLKGAPNNDITIKSYIGGTTHFRNGGFNIEGGTVTVEGQITTDNENSANTSLFSMEVGVQSGTLNLHGRTTVFVLSPIGTNSIHLNGTASLVNYSMTSSQTVLGTPYNNLTLSGSGAKNLTGATINGILSMEGTVTASGTTPAFGSFSSIHYKGSSAQTTGTEFPSIFSGSGGITISNASGVTLNNNRDVTYGLTFIAGKINTGTYTLRLGSSSVVTGAGTGKYVNGNLQKVIGTGTTSKIFEIGDASVYAPVEIQFTGTVTTEGAITASTTSGDHPDIATSTFIAGVTVNRYWTLINSGVSGFVSYSARFNYVSGDIDSGADYTNFYVGLFSSSIWIYPTVGTKASTSTQATGLTGFGDFQVGELPVASYRSKTTGDWNLISTWESFDGTVWTDATNTPSSTSGFISIRSSHTVTNTGIQTADQVIIDEGGILVLSSPMTVIDGPGVDFKVNGTLDCSNILTGPGSFLLDNNAELVIRSTDGITNSGASGDIQTTTRTFSPWANYTYNGTSAQVTGSGLPSSVNNLTINNPSGVSLISPLNINGTLILSNGEFSIGSSSLTFETSDTPVSRTSGTITTFTDSNLSFGTPLNMIGADFTLPAGTFTTAPQINNLTIYRINTLTLNDQILSVRGILLCNGPLNTNDNLTLASGVTYTGLIDGTGTGDVTGKVTMERYLPSAFGYKYMSSPFQASTVDEFNDDIDLAAVFPTLYRYDESSTTSGWVEYITPTDPLTPLAGYAANFGLSALPVTADITGTVNNGPLSVTLFNNNNTYTLGFNLIGNPYPSPIDWDAASGWTKTNIDNALYYFKASTTDEYGGTYSTYINGVSSDGLATGIIPSMQGFFVHVSDGSYPVTGTLGLTNSVRIIDFTHSFLKSERENHPSQIRLSVTSEDDQSLTDPLVIYFDEKAGEGFDRDLDALKLMNTDYFVPNFYTFSIDDSKLSINSLAWPSEETYIIPLGLMINTDGYFIFRILDIGEKLINHNIYLSDVATGTEQDLQNNNVYRVYLRQGKYNNRFYLKLSGITTQIQETGPDDNFFSIYSSHDVLKVNIDIIKTGPGTISIISLTGRVLFTQRIFNDGYHEIYPGLKDGIYIVTFESGNQRISKKIFIQN